MAAFALPHESHCSYLIDCLPMLRSSTLHTWPQDGVHVFIPRSPLVTQGLILSTLACAVFFTGLRNFLWNRILLPLAYAADIHPADHTSFCESGVQLAFYSVMWTFASIVGMRSEFFWETWRCWEWPFPNQPITSGIWWVYVLQMGWYVHCTYAHVFLDKRKRDFWQMLAHHIVTLLLLFGSMITGYFRIGILVLISMDICDVFLHSMKMLRFYDVRHPINTPVWIKTAIFIVLPTSWLLFRIIFFSVVVLWSSLYEFPKVIGWHNAHYWSHFNILLLILFSLQLYWFSLIFKITVRHLYHGDELNDTREKNLHLEEKGSKQ